MSSRSTEQTDYRGIDNLSSSQTVIKRLRLTQFFLSEGGGEIEPFLCSRDSVLCIW
jgi:hypothetical protein